MLIWAHKRAYRNQRDISPDKPGLLLGPMIYMSIKKNETRILYKLPRTCGMHRYAQAYHDKSHRLAIYMPVRWPCTTHRFGAVGCVCLCRPSLDRSTNTFKIHYRGGGDKTLPIAHTCFFRLDWCVWAAGVAGRGLRGGGDARDRYLDLPGLY